VHGVVPLILVAPLGLDHADHGLPAGMNVDVLHCDLLPPLATVAVERAEQEGIGTRRLRVAENDRPLCGARTRAGGQCQVRADPRQGAF
jgi:hypothetical protein